MPTYEYLCKTCKNRFEKWQRMTDEPLSTCPECGEPIHRVYYPAGVVFKGSGFYKTDHAASPVVDSNGQTKKGEKEPVAAGEKNGSSESKSGSSASSSNTTSTTRGEVTAPTK